MSFWIEVDGLLFVQDSESIARNEAATKTLEVGQAANDHDEAVQYSSFRLDGIFQSQRWRPVSQRYNLIDLETVYLLG